MLRNGKNLSLLMIFCLYLAGESQVRAESPPLAECESIFFPGTWNGWDKTDPNSQAAAFDGTHCSLTLTMNAGDYLFKAYDEETDGWFPVENYAFSVDAGKVDVVEMRFNKSDKEVSINVVSSTTPFEYEASSVSLTEVTFGEAAFWDGANQRLFSVDQFAPAVLVYDPKTGETKRYEDVFGGSPYVSSLVPVQGSDNELLCATDDTVGILNLDSSTYTILARNTLFRDQDIRFNDGKCDPTGRYWVGTYDEARAAGKNCQLYTMDWNAEKEEYEFNVKIAEVGNSNGIVWKQALNKMYYIDTDTGEVAVFDWDAETGAISNRQVLITVTTGYPDGMAIDKDGNLWVAAFAGAHACKYDAATGNKLGCVTTPSASQSTSVAIGGESWSTVFITTGKDDGGGGLLYSYELGEAVGTEMPYFDYKKARGDDSQDSSSPTPESLPSDTPTTVPDDPTTDTTAEDPSPTSTDQGERLGADCGVLGVLLVAGVYSFIK